MATKIVPVQVPRKQRPWFQKRRVLPVEVTVTKQRCDYAGRTFLLRDVGEGFTSVMKPGSNVPYGEFSQHAVRHTLTESALKDVKVIRAATLGLPYEVPAGVEVLEGGLVHPGPCQGGRDAIKKHMKVKDEEARCSSCGGPFM